MFFCTISIKKKRRNLLLRGDRRFTILKLPAAIRATWKSTINRFLIFVLKKWAITGREPLRERGDNVFLRCADWWDAWLTSQLTPLSLRVSLITALSVLQDSRRDLCWQRLFDTAYWFGSMSRFHSSRIPWNSLAFLWKSWWLWILKSH